MEVEGVLEVSTIEFGNVEGDVGGVLVGVVGLVVGEVCSMGEFEVG